MENPVNTEDDLQLSTEDLENLKKAGKWGKFISIVVALNAAVFGGVLFTGTIISGGYAGQSSRVYLFTYSASF